MSRPNTPADFWSHVDKSGECWPWTAGAWPNGYGRFRYHGKTWLTHRLAYVLAVGEIPPGLKIDHVKARGCTSTLCCRPDHLEPVTQRVNLDRANGIGVVNAAKTRCVNGHDFTPENTRMIRQKGKYLVRECITCRREWSRKANARRSAA